MTPDHQTMLYTEASEPIVCSSSGQFIYELLWPTEHYPLLDQVQVEMDPHQDIDRLPYLANSFPLDLHFAWMDLKEDLERLGTAVYVRCRLSNRSSMLRALKFLLYINSNKWHHYLLRWGCEISLRPLRILNRMAFIQHTCLLSFEQAT
uniref:Otoferlin n=1 Tax=Mesocestoides corti TaxID=53468 RepID=A0A5K3EPZ7_MESCO